MPFTIHSSAPRRAALLAGALGAALWLAGCASLTPKTPEEQVTARVEQRWAALIAGDFDKAWQYTQPGFRAMVKQRDYGKRFGSGGQWLGVQVHNVSCEADRCNVRIRLTTKVLVQGHMGREMTGALDETWVREDGQWWYYQAI